MKRACCVLLLWLGCLTLPTMAEQSQEATAQQRQSYRQAASALLQSYLQEQHTWNHYFTTIAPDQGAREQIAPQQKYRRFLHSTLAQWRQLDGAANCQDSHLGYELALYAYTVAADFRLIFLYARGFLLEPKSISTLAEERSRLYTTEGDTYFKQAAQRASSNGCVSLSAAEQTPP